MSVLQSIDKKFIISVLILLLLSTSKSLGNNLNNINPNSGILTLMYHRFNENKYPSTNIRNEIFVKHLEEINEAKIEFIDAKKFEELITTNIDKSYLKLHCRIYLLITIVVSIQIL